MPLPRADTSDQELNFVYHLEVASLFPSPQRTVWASVVLVLPFRRFLLVFITGIDRSLPIVSEQDRPCKYTALRRLEIAIGEVDNDYANRGALFITRPRMDRFVAVQLRASPLSLVSIERRLRFLKRHWLNALLG